MLYHRIFIFILLQVILLPSIWATHEESKSDFESDTGDITQFIINDFTRNMALSNICENKPLRKNHIHKIEEFKKSVTSLSERDLVQAKAACLILKKLETTTANDMDKIFLFIQLTGIQNSKDLMTISPRFQQVLVDMLLYCGFYNFWRSPIRINTPKNSLTTEQQLEMWKMYCDINPDVEIENLNHHHFKAIPFLWITRSFKDIQKTYQNHKIIQIRDLKSKYFLVANGPSVTVRSSLENYKHRFKEQYDSIDGCLLMNPSIIGFFGMQKDPSFYPSRTYEKLLLVCQKECCKSIVDWSMQTDWHRTISKEKLCQNLKIFGEHALLKPTKILEFHLFSEPDSFSHRTIEECISDKPILKVDCSQNI